MNTKLSLVAIVIVAAFSVAAIAAPTFAQDETGGENMTLPENGNMTADDNATMPLEDENMTADG